MITSMTDGPKYRMVFVVKAKNRDKCLIKKKQGPLWCTCRQLAEQFWVRETQVLPQYPQVVGRPWVHQTLLSLGSSICEVRMIFRPAR